MASNTATNMITLISQDGKELTVSKAAAMHSLVIKGIIEDGCTIETIPVAYVNADILEIVMEYCEKHADSSNMTEEDLKKWDQRFFYTNKAHLFLLMIATDYLIIKKLYHATCKTSIAICEARRREPIRRDFRIQPDYNMWKYM